MPTAPADAPAVRLGALRQIALTVRDVGAAVPFYRDVLGMRLLFEAPPGLAFFDCAGVRLMLAAPEGGAADADAPAGGPSGTMLYYDVPDIHAAHAALAAQGVAFGAAPHRVAVVNGREVWLAEFGDGQGNRLALMAEVPAPG